MIQQLKHLRDFLKPEQLKWLPGNLNIVSCILLSENIGGTDEPMRTLLHVFDDAGTYIGTIGEPEYIPQRRR